MALIPCEDEEVNVEFREASPSHFLIKFESFSKLSENGLDMYESSEFEACSYKWRMIIYLNGDDSIDGNNYISVYLAITDTSSLPAGWEANAVFSFFLYNHLCDNYLVIRGQARRFHKVRSKWGCSKFISHKSLKEPTNGYLVNDNCILGAEVFVIKNNGVGECVSLPEGINSKKREWKIFEFSKLREECFSEEFTVGDHKWKIQLIPNGNGDQKDQCISLFLALVDAEGFGCRKKVNAKFSISVKDQIDGAYHKKIIAADKSSPIAPTTEVVSQLIAKKSVENITPITPSDIAKGQGSSEKKPKCTRAQIKLAVQKVALDLGVAICEIHIDDILYLTDGEPSEKDILLYLRGCSRTSQLSMTTQLVQVVESLREIMSKNQQAIKENVDSNTSITENFRLLQMKIDSSTSGLGAMIKAENTSLKSLLVAGSHHPVPQSSTASTSNVPHTAIPQFPPKETITQVLQKIQVPEGVAAQMGIKYAGTVTWTELNNIISGVFTKENLKDQVKIWKRKMGEA